MATTTTTRGVLGALFSQDDRRRDAEAQRQAEGYARLVMRAADGDLADVESIDAELAALGRTRDELLADVRRCEQRRGERRRAGGVLEVMREHRAAERAVGEAERALTEAIRAGKARVQAAREAESRLRSERLGPANAADASLRLAPEALSMAFVRAERALVDVEERLAAARLRGDGPGSLAALEDELAMAEKRAAEAWRAVEDFDPPPGAVMRGAREYEPRAAALLPLPIPVPPGAAPAGA